jgi:Thymidylate synthase
MAVLTEAATGAEAYVQLGRQILSEGRKTAPRGLPCYEITDCTVTVENAVQAVPSGCGRAIQPAIGAAEYCQLLAGISWLEQLDEASGSRFSQFADNRRLRGAYGPRIYSQLQEAAARLEADPDTRQAVIVIGRGAALDSAEGQRDVPCTTCVQYRLRDGRLDATVTMRSSDWFLGIPYDWWMQSRLQMTLAWAVGAEPGAFTWQAGSQHLYEHDLHQVEKIAGSSRHWERWMPPAITLGNGMTTLNDARKRIHGAQEYARGLCLGSRVTMTVDGAGYYRDLLPVPAGTWEMCGFCRYVVPARNQPGQLLSCSGCQMRWERRHG